MIDYDLAKKLKDIYHQVDDFEKKWLSPKGFFRVLHKAGAIDEEDLNAIHTEYDRVTAPITNFQEKATDYVVDHTMRFLWNNGLMKKPEPK